MQLQLKYHGELSNYFPDNSDENIITVNINQDDSICSVMDKFNIPHAKISLILVNGINVKDYDCENYRFSDGDTLAIWPVTK